MIKLNSSIRESNVQLVLSEVMNHPEISRAQISVKTGLNKATVSEIVRKLINDHYIIETGTGSSSSTGGRKPILLKINKRAGVSISFDIRFDKLSYMITYLNGDVIYTDETYVTINKKNIVSIIEEIVNDYRQTLKEIPFGIIGIAIAVHGIVSENNILFTPYYDLDQIDLASLLTEKLDMNVLIENEANLSALAESTFHPEYDNLVSCSIHSGIGAGIIQNHILYRGFEGRSGEIGHTVLYPDGINCPCGNKGCFEQYCSQRALVQKFQDMKNNPSLSFKSLVQSYNEGDKETNKLISEFTHNLSIGLGNLIGMYGPEVVYINSKIVREIPRVLEIVKENLSKTIYKHVKILPSTFSKHMSLYGATVLNIQHFLQIDSLEFPTDSKVTS